MAARTSTPEQRALTVRIVSIVLALDVLIFDRIHKFYQINIEGWTGGEFVRVFPFFDYVLVWNTGVSYGLLADLPRWVISIGLGAIVAVLAVWLVRSKSFLTRLGLGMVIAGATSNLIDRFIYGAVADFFHLHWGEWSFFVFNIADVGITFGAILLIFDMVFPRKLTKA